jgi:hypothetical protein
MVHEFLVPGFYAPKFHSDRCLGQAGLIEDMMLLENNYVTKYTVHKNSLLALTACT